MPWTDTWRVTRHLPGRQGNKKHFNRRGGNNRFKGIGVFREWQNSFFPFGVQDGRRVASSRNMMKNYVSSTSVSWKWKKWCHNVINCPLHQRSSFLPQKNFKPFECELGAAPTDTQVPEGFRQHHPECWAVTLTGPAGWWCSREGHVALSSVPWECRATCWDSKQRKQ